MIHIDSSHFSSQIEQLSRELSEISYKRLQAAHYSASKRAARSVKAAIVKDTARETGVKTKTLNKRFKIRILKPGSLYQAIIFMDRRGISAFNQGAKGLYRRRRKNEGGMDRKKNGVRYGRGRFKVHDKHAFIRRGKNNNVHVFKREDRAARYPIAVQTIEIRKEASEAIQKSKKDRYIEIYNKRLEHELKRRIETLRNRRRR